MGTCSSISCHNDRAEGNVYCEQCSIHDNLEKGNYELVGYTVDKVWTPFKHPWMFFGGLIISAISFPVALDQWGVFSALSDPTMLKLGWSTLPISFLAMAFGYTGVIMILCSIFSASHIAVGIVKKNPEPAPKPKCVESIVIDEDADFMKPRSVTRSRKVKKLG